MTFIDKLNTLKTLYMQNKLLNGYKSPYLIFTPKDNLVDFAPLHLPLTRFYYYE